MRFLISRRWSALPWRRNGLVFLANILLGGAALGQFEAEIASLERQRQQPQVQHQQDNRRRYEEYIREKQALAGEIRRLQADLNLHATNCDYQQALRRGDRNFDSRDHDEHVREQRELLAQVSLQSNFLSPPVATPFSGNEYDAEIARLRREAGNERFRQNAERTRQEIQKFSDTAAQTLGQAIRDAGKSRPPARPRRSVANDSEREPAPARDYDFGSTLEIPAASSPRGTVAASTASREFGNGEVAPAPPVAPLPQRLRVTAEAAKELLDVSTDVVRGKVANQVERLEATLEEFGDRAKLSSRVLDAFGSAAQNVTTGNSQGMRDAAGTAQRAAEAYSGSLDNRVKRVAPETALPQATQRLKDAFGELTNPKPQPTKP
jgi:hypothetical protein